LKDKRERDKEESRKDEDFPLDEEVMVEEEPEWYREFSLINVGEQV